jgi:hypothetical protein
LTRERNAASSSEPFLKGVTKAVNDPRNFVLAAMDFLRTRREFRASPIHIGSVRPVKDLLPTDAPFKPRFCRGGGANPAKVSGCWYFVRIFNQIQPDLVQIGLEPID